MKKLKAAKQSGVRARIDLSALYPSDQVKLLAGPRAKSRARDDEARKAAELRAVREALSGWRWL